MGWFRGSRSTIDDIMEIERKLSNLHDHSVLELSALANYNIVHAMAQINYALERMAEIELDINALPTPDASMTAHKSRLYGSLLEARSKIDKLYIARRSEE